MAIDLDDEIVQDFLVEASEILETLNEQAVDLETAPDDADLLNAVFRGFHTIKGGAGFLALDNLVHVAHKCEDLFDLLRQGERSIDADLMDVVLRVLDVLNEMFEEIRNGDDPSPAPADLLETLKILADKNADIDALSQATAPAPAQEVTPQANANVSENDMNEIVDALSGGAPETEASSSATNDSEDITEEEFENLLDELHGAGGSPTATSTNDASSETSEPQAPAENNAPQATAESGDSEDITEEEFEALLDQLHGEGGSPTAAGDQSPETPAPAETAAKPAPAASGDNNSEDITEEEFENLLDELHGAGGSPTAGNNTPATEPTAEAKAENPAAETPAPAASEESKEQAEKSAPAQAEKTKVPEPPAKAEVKAPAKAAAKDSKAKAAPPTAEATVRVETSTLDSIMNLVGELVLIRNRMSNLKDSLNDEEMTKSAATLDMITTDLQNVVLKTRMQPIKKIFGRFPRVVRDLARSLGREVNLEMFGEDTDLDKNLVEALSDPLVHLVRNAVDHGIETPEIRTANGKPRKGTLKLGAKQEGDHVLLTISDDGAGMDPNILRKKAVEKGMMDEDAAARLEDRECFELIFSAGFSTKTEISDVSGRGVGMDVVKTRINQLNGVIEIDSKKGEGTKLSIKLPLTLAIMPTLMVILGKQIFALPLVNVKEIMDFEPDEVNVVDKQDVIVVRGKALPIFNLSRWLVTSPIGMDESKDPGHVVIVNVGTQQVGLLVDHLIGQEEVVIKPLGANLQGTKGLAGATITGDGRIALILDLPSLIGHYARR